MKVHITLNVKDNTPVECIEKAFDKMVKDLNCDCSYIIGCDRLSNSDTQRGKMGNENE